MNEILENMKNLDPDERLGFEAIGKTFRSLERWYELDPCFKEELQKTPLYKIYL
jgi:hypothetical protein